MSKNCAVDGCLSRRGGLFHLFSIPNNPRIRQKWLEFLSIHGKPSDKASEVQKICELHFAPELINKNSMRITLAQEAIPSIASLTVFPMA